MSTTRSFQEMLNEYLPNELLREEMIKRDFLLSKVEKDDSWKGGALIVPFKAAGASSVAFGSLSASNDIAEDKYVRGSVAGHKEVWGSMLFNHRDLMEHDMVSEQNFLKILPQAVEDFMDYMKQVVSVNLMNGSHFAKTTAVSTANDGVVTVDHPDRLVIGQKVVTTASDASQVTSYVKSIDMNTKKAVLVTTRGGSTVVDFSAAGKDLASGEKLYNDGAIGGTTAFSSLRDALLSAANGGSANLHGQSKAAYPYLQAINVLGSAITASNILQKIFEALTTIRQLGKGNPTDVIMSYKHLGSAMQVIETQKGSFNVTPGSQKATQYGWTEIEVGSVTKGGLKLVGVQEMDDDIIIFLDWRALKFHSNGFFQKRKSPDGKEYFETRATSGYQYIIDVCLFGELVVTRPSYCGIIYSISY
jgi:hypothetical protein